MTLTGFWRLFALLDQEYDADDETLRARIGKAREYVDQKAHRADVVANLPANAPPGYFMVKAGDPNLYIGTGMSTPLRRIPTQALP